MHFASRPPLPPTGVHSVLSRSKTTRRGRAAPCGTFATGRGFACSRCRFFIVTRVAARLAAAAATAVCGRGAASRKAGHTFAGTCVGWAAGTHSTRAATSPGPHRHGRSSAMAGANSNFLKFLGFRPGSSGNRTCEIQHGRAAHQPPGGRAAAGRLRAQVHCPSDSCPGAVSAARACVDDLKKHALELP